MKNRLISRRSVLAGTAAAGALSLTGIPAARAEVQWKKYAGTKLEVILAKGPRGDNFQKNIKEFTDLTGIQVESEQIPEQQQRQKAVIELASGKPSFDVIHLSYHVQKRQFEKGGWLADLHLEAQIIKGLVIRPIASSREHLCLGPRPQWRPRFRRTVTRGRRHRGIQLIRSRRSARCCSGLIRSASRDPRQTCYTSRQ